MAFCGTYEDVTKIIAAPTEKERPASKSYQKILTDRVR